MLPGPVFQFELMTTARRGHFYVMRVAFALVVFLVLWENHYAWYTFNGGELSASQVSWFAMTTFLSLAVFQMVVLLIVTPALVAPVIADEKQRRTLHYLLSSDLTSAEIVVGKLLSRMLHIVIFLMVGFPVMCLLSLLGGIDPRLVVLAWGWALTTAFFLSSLAILVSTLARRVREAVFIVYAPGAALADRPADPAKGHLPPDASRLVVLLDRDRRSNIWRRPARSTCLVGRRPR